MQRGPQARRRSVNLGGVEGVEHQGRRKTTGIFKHPTAEGGVVTTPTCGSAVQADRRAHGGPDRVAYAYAEEHLEWWADELDRPVPPGSMGENLTTAGLDVTGALIGERWRIGTALFEVAALRTPCFKLGIRM